MAELERQKKAKESERPKNEYAGSAATVPVMDTASVPIQTAGGNINCIHHRIKLLKQVSKNQWAALDDMHSSGDMEPEETTSRRQIRPPVEGCGYQPTDV